MFWKIQLLFKSPYLHPFVVKNIISHSYIQRKSWLANVLSRPGLENSKKKFSKSSLSYASNDSSPLLALPSSNPTSCSTGHKDPMLLQGSQWPSCSKLRKRSDQQQVGQPVPLIMAQISTLKNKFTGWFDVWTEQSQSWKLFSYIVLSLFGFKFNTIRCLKYTAISIEVLSSDYKNLWQPQNS